MTRFAAARARAAARRSALSTDPWVIVEALDQITAVWPDPRTRPVNVAAVHDQLTARLHRKETP